MNEKNNDKLLPALCPQCGAIIRVDSGKEAAICEYCQSAFIVDKAVENYTINNTTVINQAKQSGFASIVNFVDNERERKLKKSERWMEYLQKNQEFRMRQYEEYLKDQQSTDEFRKKHPILSALLMVFLLLLMIGIPIGILILLLKLSESGVLSGYDNEAVEKIRSLLGL